MTDHLKCYQKNDLKPGSDMEFCIIFLQQEPSIYFFETVENFKNDTDYGIFYRHTGILDKLNSHIFIICRLTCQSLKYNTLLFLVYQANSNYWSIYSIIKGKSDHNGHYNWASQKQSVSLSLRYLVLEKREERSTGRQNCLLT